MVLYYWLQQTYPLINSSKVIKDVAAGGGRILHARTKRQAQKVISKVLSILVVIWIIMLGGTLIQTISKSIVRLNYDEILNKNSDLLKRVVGIQRQRDKLEAY